MATYLVTFTPREPYFFGNEKNFLHPGHNAVSQTANAYFIRSETVPSQTTLFGALRYLLLPVKKARWSEYDPAELTRNSEAVGEASFCYGEQRTFGKIRSISPMVLMDDNREIYVVTPFDHIHGKKTYTPFTEYGSVTTPQGERLYAKEFNAKDGVEHSYMHLKSGNIVKPDTLFHRETRVGIKRLATTNGFFKKEYVRPADGYCFAVYLTLEDGHGLDDQLCDQTVFLGQGRSLFTVHFEKCEKDDPWKDVENDIRKHLRDGMHYCVSDAFVSDTVYDNATFSATAVRDHRSYTTDCNGRVSKHPVLYKLICAGSVFQGDNVTACFTNENAETVGFNHIV